MAESRPLVSLDQLLHWCPPRAAHAVAALAGHRRALCRRTLLCHDMKGGYLEDRFDDGCDDDSAYRFYHWSAIDIFVYFSHNLVTIPPTGWITASHRNGVPVLGTVIVEEWAQNGSSLARDMLRERQTVERVCDSLTQIAKFYRFDGWLLNFECALEPSLVENLLYFVRLLTDTMHAESAHSLVIWYDSVTCPEGALDWQNELNAANKCFFDACDGIFLNYTWTAANLANSRALSADRKHDVFVGIDVFGRNCFGGGGMNTSAALDVVLEHELSAAIFAPAWTHEVLGCEQFVANENRFWRALDAHVHHYPSRLPLCTCFCQGCGKRTYRNGRVVDHKPWHNLNKQQLQPSRHTSVELHLDDAFNGGACLRLKQSSASLFDCDLEIRSQCVYAIAYKSRHKVDTIFRYNDNERARVCEISANELRVERITNEELSRASSTMKDMVDNACNDWRIEGFLLDSEDMDSAFTLRGIDVSCASVSDADVVLIGQLMLFSLND